MKKIKMIIFTFTLMLGCTMGANAYSMDYSTTNGTKTANITVDDAYGYYAVKVEKSVYDNVSSSWNNQAAVVKEKEDAFNANLTEESAVAWRTEFEKFKNLVKETTPNVDDSWIADGAATEFYGGPSTFTVTIDLSKYENGDVLVLWTSLGAYEGADTNINVYTFDSTTETFKLELNLDEILNIPYHCTFTNGNYYGDMGYKTTKEEFIKSCSCQFSTDSLDKATGQYYDKNGNSVTKTEYEKSCLSCDASSERWNKNERIKIYHDINGQEVTKAEYEKSCSKTQNNNSDTVDNPKTGYTLPLVAGLLIVIVGGVTVVFVNRKKLFKQI